MSKGIDTGLVDRVITATRAIRDLVNIGRRHRRIMRDSPSYNTIASAMYTLADTAEAVSAYGKRDADRDETYLLSYGVLQALYLQQDAAFWLCKLLDVQPVSSFRSPGSWAHSVLALDAARTARNNSIGHPVRREKNGPLASFSLVQSSLRVGRFQLIEAEGEQRRFVSIDVSNLAHGQLTAIAALLDDAARQLRDADNTHKRRFMNDKLRTIFDRLDHAVSHLGAISSSDNRLMMPGFANFIRQGLSRFRDALSERQEPFEADLEYRYRKLNRALQVLDDHVAGEGYADADLAEVAATLVHYELDRLKGYAQEIDDDYAEGAEASASPDGVQIDQSEEKKQE